MLLNLPDVNLPDVFLSKNFKLLIAQYWLVPENN